MATLLRLKAAILPSPVASTAVSGVASHPRSALLGTSHPLVLSRATSSVAFSRTTFAAGRATLPATTLFSGTRKPLSGSVPTLRRRAVSRASSAASGTTGSGANVAASATASTVSEPATEVRDAGSAPQSASNLGGFEFPVIKEAKRVVLVRHGESTWNATGRIQGSSDFSVLTAKGESQAETSRQMLAADSFDVCFHSPLQRSARTAEVIWAARTAPMIPLHDLREIDLYSFQGLFKEEGKARFGENYRMWQKDAANFEIDGHYPVRELWARAAACWQEILRSEGRSKLVVAHNAVNQALVATATGNPRSEGRSVVVVVHNAVKQALVATATGLGPEYFRLLLQSNCGVSVLDFVPHYKPHAHTHTPDEAVPPYKAHDYSHTHSDVPVDASAAAAGVADGGVEGEEYLLPYVCLNRLNQVCVAAEEGCVWQQKKGEKQDSSHQVSESQQAYTPSDETVPPYKAHDYSHTHSDTSAAMVDAAFAASAAAGAQAGVEGEGYMLPYTPAPPVMTGGASGGRKAEARVILVCHRDTSSSAQRRFPQSPYEQLSMLGPTGTPHSPQARKTAELLLDVRVDTVFCSLLPHLPLLPYCPPYPSAPVQTPAPPVMTGGASGGRKAKARVILVCHGDTSSSAQRRFPQSPFEQLSMLGVVQARKTAELLLDTPAPPVMTGGASGGRKAKARVILVRHGDTSSSAQRRFPQSPFEQLSMLGVVQARKTAELLLDVRVDTVFCSPLPRAVRTAEAVVEVQEAAECLGADCVPRFVDIVPVEELRELEYGTWQGAMMAEVSAHERWEDQIKSSPPPNGESLPSLWGRAEKAWTVIRRHLAEVERATSASAGADMAAAKGAGPGSPPTERSETVIVVGHETVFQAMLASCLKLPHDALGSFRLDPGSITVVDFPDGVGEPKDSSESDNKGYSAAGAAAAGQGIAAGVVGQGVLTTLLTWEDGPCPSPCLRPMTRTSDLII
ncbi:unnamed protein product [Closterium sp. Naga37s-1]|nr:unnamed protein product [Closterium sp. Naga37s-1]